MNTKLIVALSGVTDVLAELLSNDTNDEYWPLVDNARAVLAMPPETDSLRDRLRAKLRDALIDNQRIAGERNRAHVAARLEVGDEMRKLRARVAELEARQVVPEFDWHVSVTDHGEKKGAVTISGPGVYCMEMPVSYSMLDFFSALESMLAAPTPPAVPPVPEPAAAVERQRCLSIIRAYEVPVGNSAAGELAAEWTMDALREVCGEIERGAIDAALAASKGAAQ